MWLIVALLTTLIILYYKWSFGYWKRKKLSFLEPKFLIGNIQVEYPGYFNFAEFYKTMKQRGCKHGGYYSFFRPVYIPIDLEYVKLIMIKEFSAFSHRGVDYSEYEPFSKNVFTMSGIKWKELRNELTPSFSTGKLKQYVELIVRCAEGMKDFLEKTEGAVEIKEACTNYSVDVIGSCAFGLECNSFKNSDAEFRKHTINHFALTPFKMFKVVAIFLFPKLISLFGTMLVCKATIDFYLKTIRGVLEYREKHDYRRNDTLQTFIDYQKSQKSEVTAENIAGHIYLFFVAGHETAATTTSFALFEMAKNKEIQNKVREEIVEVLERHGGKITYESLSELKYTEQVIDETLRMYPPVPMHSRRATRNFQIPGTDVIIESGTLIIVPILAIHNDPDYFKDPHVFDPERFSVENKSNILPIAYQPFGAGPRTCIAIKFAVIEMKIAIITAIRDFEISLNPKTPSTPEWEPSWLVLKNKHKMLLDFKRIKK